MDFFFNAGDIRDIRELTDRPWSMYVSSGQGKETIGGWNGTAMAITITVLRLSLSRLYREKERIEET